MELSLSHPASRTEEACALGNGCTGAMVFGNPHAERITLTARAPEKNSVWISLGEISIDWLDAEQPMNAYRRALNLQDGLSITTWERNGAGITQTVLVSRADNVLLIHLLADKPGALNFRVRLGASSDPQVAVTGERGELVRKDSASHASEVRAWVLPFESEVNADGNAMIVQGEGEAMIVVAAATRADVPSLKTTFARLVAKYEPTEDHPDFPQLWRKMQENHLKAFHEKFSLAQGGGRMSPIQKGMALLAYLRVQSNNGK